MSRVIVEDVSAEGSTLRASVTVTGDLQRFFTTEDFLAEYPVPIESVPEGILVIPVLAHVAPPAWTQDADVHVRTVDSDFAEALENVQDTLMSMYPSFMEGGELIVTQGTTDNSIENTYDQSGQLFTGGVDSLATYIRHRDEDPALISVNGWTEPLDDELWDKRKAVLEDFAERFGVENHFIRSNMLSFIDHTMLIAHFKRYVLGSWYSSVGHGLGMLGLCAPLAYATGLGKIYIASSFTEEYDYPWGSHPDIDNNVRWAGTQGAHDAFELTRQEKIELIVDYAREEWSNLPIRTCNKEVDSNCGKCEKCCRTSLGLILAEEDPNEHGYDFDEDKFEYTRRSLKNGRWDITDAEYEWMDLQDHISYDRDFPVAGAESFFRWLESVSVMALSVQSGSPMRDQMLRMAVRNTPYEVYSSLYPIYSQIKEIKSR